MPHPNSIARVLAEHRFTCQYCPRRLYLPQAIKMLDSLDASLDLYDNHGRKDPLRTCWATVDHILALNNGGTDCLGNLAACCVICNSKKGANHRELLLRSTQDDWLGYADYFLAYWKESKMRMTKTDREWLRALEWAGIKPTSKSWQCVVDELKRTYKDSTNTSWSP